MKIEGIVLLLLTAAALLGGSDGTTGPATDGSAVVAAVDGTPITLAEFERTHPLALFQARNAFYDAERKALEAYLDDALLENQAAKEHVTVAKLLENHVNSKIAPDPSDDALEVYYEGLDTTEPFLTMKDKIRDHLRERRIGKAKMAYLQSLRSHADLSVQITPPRAEVKVGEAPLRGTRDGIVTLIEFADYECPYCQQIAPELARIETEYKGRLAFVYKDFPLPMHPHAQKAAEAALCAGEQNKYWEYHDLLLSSKKLDTSDLKESAQQVGLDTEGFNSCIDSGRMAAKVRANLDEATQLGLTGTPAFLLNGRLISGSMSYDQLHQLFEDEIKASVRPATAAAQQ